MPLLHTMLCSKSVSGMLPPSHRPSTTQCAHMQAPVAAWMRVHKPMQAGQHEAVLLDMGEYLLPADASGTSCRTSSVEGAGTTPKGTGRGGRGSSSGGRRSSDGGGGRPNWRVSDWVDSRKSSVRALRLFSSQVQHTHFTRAPGSQDFLAALHLEATGGMPDGKQPPIAEAAGRQPVLGLPNWLQLRPRSKLDGVCVPPQAASLLWGSARGGDKGAAADNAPVAAAVAAEALAAELAVSSDPMRAERVQRAVQAGLVSLAAGIMLEASSGRVGMMAAAAAYGDRLHIWQVRVMPECRHWV